MLISSFLPSTDGQGSEQRQVSLTVRHRGRGSLYSVTNRLIVMIILQYIQIQKHYNCIAATATAAKSPQSCPTLCDPIDGSPPGSPVPGILQARTLEWVAISFSSAWKWKVKVKSLSRVWPSVTPWTAAFQGFQPSVHGIFQARVLVWGAMALELDSATLEWNLYSFCHSLKYKWTTTRHLRNTSDLHEKSQIQINNKVEYKKKE